LHSFLCAVGGCRIDVALGNADFAGGELGGVTICEAEGAGPGGQKGKCLFGMGVDGRGVFKVRAGVIGGGVTECRRDG